jgi:type II secretory pathway pseudopilin PulG
MARHDASATPPRSWAERAAFLVVVIVVILIAGGLYQDLLDRAHRAYVDQVEETLEQTGNALEAFRQLYGTLPAAVNPPGAAERVQIPDAGTATRPGLTTPVAFLSALPLDYFADPRGGRPLAYHVHEGEWLLYSPGPDGHYDIVPERDFLPAHFPLPSLILATYDPSNGTTSAGDLWRASPRLTATPSPVAQR